MFHSYTTRFVTYHYFSSLHDLVLYPVQSEYAVGASMLANVAINLEGGQFVKTDWLKLPEPSSSHEVTGL